jgi:hypothetical protein
MTTEDKRAQIDRRFDETFAVFDARMRKEQEAISQERAGRAGSAGAVGGTGTDEESGAGGESARTGNGQGQSGEGAGAEGEQGSGEQGSGEASGQGEGGEGAGDQQGSGQQSSGGGVGGGGPKGGAGPAGVPSDIPDGRDDDIVARQLREAAMKETDPELRERLWEEYRKYKQSTT